MAKYLLSTMKYNPLLLLLLLLVAAIAVGDYFMPYGPFCKTPSWPSAASSWTGVVTQPPHQSGKVERIVLRLTADASLVQLTAVDDTVHPAPPPAVGDIIAFHAIIEEPHNAGNPGEVDYAAYLRHQGLTGQAFCLPMNWRNLGRSSSLSLRERMLIARGHIAGVYARHFEGEALAIVSAMTLGDRTRIDRSLRQLYNRCGASHVLALSGLHLSILFIFLGTVLLRPLRRWGRVGQIAAAALALTLMWLYVLFTGLPISLVRSASMFTIMTLLRLLRRQPTPHHSLLLALIIILLCSPSSLFDVGLQLSAVSVAAIIFATRWAEEAFGSADDQPLLQIRYIVFRLRFENSCPRFVLRFLQKPYVRAAFRVLFMLVVVSTAAQVATFPLVVHYFGRFSFIGISASLILIPAVYVIIFGTLLFLLLPPLRALFAAMLAEFLAALHGLMNTLGNLPFANVEMHLSWWGVVGFYLLLVSIFVSIGRRRRLTTPAELRRQSLVCGVRTLAVATLISFCIVGVELCLGILQRPSTHIAIYNRTGHSEVHLVTPTTDSILTAASPHLAHHVLLFAQRRVAIVSAPLPYIPHVAIAAPLPVDAVLLTRGAQGHLHDVLLRYQPSLVVLDGSLSDYYRQRFTAEASAASLPLYDVGQQGALMLYAPHDAKKVGR